MNIHRLPHQNPVILVAAALLLISPLPAQVVTPAKPTPTKSVSDEVSSPKKKMRP